MQMGWWSEEETRGEKRRKALSQQQQAGKMSVVGSRQLLLLGLSALLLPCSAGGDSARLSSAVPDIIPPRPARNGATKKHTRPRQGDVTNEVPQE